jgi:hypothetical protein
MKSTSYGIDCQSDLCVDWNQFMDSIGNKLMPFWQILHDMKVSFIAWVRSSD